MSQKTRRLPAGPPKMCLPMIHQRPFVNDGQVVALAILRQTLLEHVYVLCRETENTINYNQSELVTYI